MSRKLPVTLAVFAFVLTPTLASAGNGSGKAGHCPPGLAKKAVPCVPPGQAKNYYKKGDYIARDYRWINDPNRYGLRRDGYYIRAGDYVYRVDPDTQKVLNLIGAVADILY
ncbi:hypothetical protein [Ruegeria meonggei]|uniref:Nickel/cobalt homeostasis protein RcnB n=1 Tax=Ruegeria meonggei TaxID=1446476 RepID=A0A1X7A2C6_9RHOB|nr:hypothetical protein [Ruegeria meonggei]SLN68097.1 hypothetical protein RUM8411_03427 [Ruegeria meonggei]